MTTLDLTKAILAISAVWTVLAVGWAWMFFQVGQYSKAYYLIGIALSIVIGIAVLTIMALDIKEGREEG